MNKRCFCILIFLFYSLFSFSHSYSASNNNKPTIAVLNFIAPADDSELVGWGKRYCEMLCVELSKDNSFILVERNEIDKIIKEMELKLAKLSSLEQSISIGKMLGADFLIVGELNKVEDTIDIEAHLVQVSTGNILAKEKLKCGQDELSSQSSKLSSLFLMEFSKIAQVKKPDKEYKTIALLRFKNKSKFKRLNHLEETLPQMLMDDLKLIPGVLVLERQHIEKILAEIQLTEFGLIENATAQKAVGADFIISGSFEERIESGKPVEESDLEIAVDIKDVVGQTALGKIEIEGKTKELERLEKEIVGRIVRALNIPLSIDEAFAGIEKGRLLEATIHYIKGLQIIGIQRLEEGLGKYHWGVGIGGAVETRERYRAALNEFQKSMYLNLRSSVELRFVIAACYKIIGDKKKSADEFRQIIKAFPDSKWAGESLWELYEVGDYDDHIDFLKQLVTRYPDHERVCTAYKFMAEAYEYNGNYLKATEAYSKYIENFPSKWEYWNSGHVDKLISFVDCYLKLNKPEKAGKILEGTLKKNPNVPLSDVLHTKLGDIYNDCYNDSERAIAEYQAATTCCPDYRTFKKLADTYLTLAKWKEAKESYTKAVSYLSAENYDQKRMINSYLKKACACEHLGEWKETLNCYEMIADKYDVTDKIKMCYEKMGKDIPAAIELQELSSLRYTKENGLAHNNITALAVDKEGVWIATSADWHAPLSEYGHSVRSAKEVINYYNKKAKSWKKYGEKDNIFIRPVTCIVVDKDTVWFGTLGGGVLRYNKTKDEWSNYTTKDGLFGDIVYIIDVDYDYVWFGGGSGDYSELKGWVCRMNKLDEKWYVYIPPKLDGEPCPRIISLKSDAEYLWAGMAKVADIFCFHKLTGKWENLTSLAYYNWSGQFTCGGYGITAIKIDDNSIWLGTKESGLRKYDKSNNKWESFYASYMASYFRPSYKTENIPANCNLPDNRINSLAIDDNYLYIAAGGGLCAYSKKDNNWIVIKSVPHDTNLDFEHGYSTSGDEIMTIAVDEDSIWCGTKGCGLIRYSKPPALSAESDVESKNSGY